jgi:hypothetical protein
MSAIDAASNYASDLASLLFSNSPGPSQAPSSGGPDAESGTGSATASDTGSDSGPAIGQTPATHVDLSDKVKDILARANSDQVVADRFQAFVESHRSIGSDGSSHGGRRHHGFDVNKGFAQLSGASSGDDGSDNDYAPVEVEKNFATGLKADGYTISAVGRARDGSFQIQIVGPDGNSYLDRRFGTSGEFSSFGGIGPGEAAQSYQRGNKEYITFSDSEAAATNITASSDAGFVSATSAATHTSSVTFVVDFSNGSISVAKSESTSVATTVQIGTPGSRLSTSA